MSLRVISSPSFSTSSSRNRVSLFLDPGGRPGLPGWNGRPGPRDWDAADPDDDDDSDDDSFRRTRDRDADDPDDDDSGDDGFKRTRSVITDSS